MIDCFLRKGIAATSCVQDHIRKAERKQLRVYVCVSGVVVQLPKNIVLNTEPERAVTIPDL